VAAFGAGSPGSGTAPDLVAGRRAALERVDERADGEDRLAGVPRLHDRLAVEGRREHVVDLRDQPVFAVVVVDDEDAISREVVRTDSKDCSVNRKDSSRMFAVELTRVSESGSAKMTRSYFLSVLRRNARPSFV
jgi:hypothetical protein